MKVIPSRIYFDQLDQVRNGSRKVLSSDNPRFLHDLRVAILRLESVAKVFHKFIRLNKDLKDRLKSARKRMGELREFDILLSSLNSVLKNASLKNKIEQQRMKRRQRLVNLLRSPSYENLLKDLSGIAIGQEPITKTFIFKKLSAAFKNVSKCKSKMTSADDMHKIRIAFKKLRYTCEFFNKPCGVIIKFQDILGKHQDAVSSMAILENLVPLKKSKEIDSFILRQKRIIKNVQNSFKRKWERDFEVISASIRPSAC